jgi:hypothetical protein
MKYFLLLTSVLACSSTNNNKLSTKAKDLEVYGTKPTCSVVGKVVGVDKMGSKEIALNHAINQAAELGATGIFVNQEVPNGSKMQVFATAYQCD